MALQTVTITVTDQVPSAVADAAVAVYAGTRRTLYAGGRTGVGGVASFAFMPAGAYTAVVTGRGFSCPEVAFTVADTGVTQNFAAVGVRTTITEPTAPLTCLLYGHVSVDPGVTVEVVIDEVAEGRTGALLAASGSGVNPEHLLRVGKGRTVVARGGRWEAYVVRGTRITVRVPGVGYEKALVVPDQATADVFDVKPLPYPAPQGLVGDPYASSSPSGR